MFDSGTLVFSTEIRKPMIHITENPALGLYIHLPWCEKKCPYCDFNSHQSSDVPEQRYIDELLKDLEQELPKIWGRSIETIFIGGGTPSMFSGEAIKQMMSSLRAYLNFSPHIEITMESNPGSAQLEKYMLYKEAGINRLSIGAQSFNDRQLSLLGRIHNSEQINDAIVAARAAGFENINLDIMFALPEQSLENCLSDLNSAIELGVEHLSFYQLTLEPNTLFHSQQPQNLPNDDLAWAMQQQGHDLLKSAGYEQYEISAFAKPKKQCLHNLNYWQFGDYVGIGAGAHGKITSAAQQKISRQQKVRKPEEFMSLSALQKCSQTRDLSEQDLIFEFMLNALRLTNGFPLALFCQTTGLKSGLILPTLEKAVEKKLLTINRFRISPTALGLQFHNDLQELFLNVEIKQNINLMS